MVSIKINIFDQVLNVLPDFIFQLWRSFSIDIFDRNYFRQSLIKKSHELHWAQHALIEIFMTAFHFMSRSKEPSETPIKEKWRELNMKRMADREREVNGKLSPSLCRRWQWHIVALKDLTLRVPKICLLCSSTLRDDELKSFGEFSWVKSFIFFLFVKKYKVLG